MGQMDRTPYPSETQDRFLIRLPEGLRDRIAAEAKIAGRSMNAEFVARLQRSLEGDSPINGTGLSELLKRMEALEGAIKARPNARNNPTLADNEWRCTAYGLAEAHPNTHTRELLMEFLMLVERLSVEDGKAQKITEAQEGLKK